MAVITNTEYKTYAGITGSDLDTVITNLIAELTAKAERYTNRTFEQATLTETYDGDDSQLIQLRSPPIGTLTSVSTLDDSGNSTALDSTTYRVNTLNGWLHRLPVSDPSRITTDAYGSYETIGNLSGVRFPRGHQNVVVVYQGGWATIPDDLKLAYYRMLDALLPQRGQDLSLSSESMGSYSWTRGGLDALEGLMEEHFGPFRLGSGAL